MRAGPDGVRLMPVAFHPRAALAPTASSVRGWGAIAQWRCGPAALLPILLPVVRIPD